MKYIQQCLILLLMSTLVACSSSNTRPTEGEKRDKEAAVLNVQLASGYIRRGNLEVAQEKLLKAISFDDKYVPAYTTLAVLMNMIGDVEKAEEYYLEALDIASNDPDLHNNYGAFLCNHGKYEEAKEQFYIALKNQFYETPEAAHSNLGYCLMQGKTPDYNTAEKHLRQALAKNPNNGSALLAMGELGLYTKKYLMSRAYMQRYHALVRPNANSLWVQIQAEHALGDRDFFIKLSKQLLKKFPESEEANKVMELSNK